MSERLQCLCTCSVPSLRRRGPQGRAGWDPRGSPELPGCLLLVPCSGGSLRPVYRAASDSEKEGALCT